MDIENLVKMANNIADFFKAEPEHAAAVEGVADHLRRFWESRMRLAIVKHYQAGGTGLSEIASDAVALLAKEQETAAQAGHG